MNRKAKEEKCRRGGEGEAGASPTRSCRQLVLSVLSVPVPSSASSLSVALTCGLRSASRHLYSVHRLYSIAQQNMAVTNGLVRFGHSYFTRHL